MDKQFCSYYQVGLPIEKIWFVVGVFRNEDHIAFERAMPNQPGVLEFFVPTGQEAAFVELIKILQSKAYVLWCEKKPNRLELEN